MSLVDSLLKENKQLKLKKKKLGYTVAGVFVYPSITMINSFFIMLGLGAAHDQWPVVPALGYWTTYLITVGIACMAGAIHGGNRIKFEKEGI